MDLRRATLIAVIPLAMLVSAVAAVVTVALELAGDVSRPSLIVSVMIAGFVASWVRSGHVADDVRMQRHTLVPVDRT